jgi:hypothetical protein
MPHGLHRGLLVVRGAAVDEQVVSSLDALPAAVAVHRIPAADDRADPHSAARTGRPQLAAPPFEQRDVPDARFGRGVAAVGEAVDHEVAHRETPGELHQRLQVAEARVHATVGHQPDQVHPLGAGERVDDRRVLAQHPVEHGIVDAREILADDGAGAEVEVADLGVAHLPFGQPHSAPAGRQCGVRVGDPQLVEHRRARQRDGVAGTGIGEPPAIQHDQAGAGQRRVHMQRPHGRVGQAGQGRKERSVLSTRATEDADPAPPYAFMRPPARSRRTYRPAATRPPPAPRPRRGAPAATRRCRG